MGVGVGVGVGVVAGATSEGSSVSSGVATASGADIMTAMPKRECRSSLIVDHDSPSVSTALSNGYVPENQANDSGDTQDVYKRSK